MRGGRTVVVGLLTVVGSLGVVAIPAVSPADTGSRGANCVRSDSEVEGDLIGPPSYVQLRHAHLERSQRTLRMEITVDSTLPRDDYDLSALSGPYFGVTAGWRLTLDDPPGSVTFTARLGRAGYGVIVQDGQDLSRATGLLDADVRVRRNQATSTSTLSVELPMRGTSMPELPERFRWAAFVSLDFAPLGETGVRSASTACPLQPPPFDGDSIAFPNSARVPSAAKVDPCSDGALQAAAATVAAADPELQALGPLDVLDPGCESGYALLTLVDRREALQGITLRRNFMLVGGV